VLAGKPFPVSDVAAAQQMRAQALGDREWVARYLAGDSEAVWQMTTLNAIISAGAGEA
jgi:hypothetical protein